MHWFVLLARKNCEIAKEVSDTLAVTHEGTNQVKELKISILTHHYELLTMKCDECIKDMYTRFSNIINGVTSLGKSYPMLTSFLDPCQRHGNQR